MNIRYKKILIYGTGRLQKDFEYMFPKINIIGYIVDGKKYKKHDGKICYNINSLNYNFIKKYLIVICERKNDEITKKIEKLGAVYKKNYYYLEDLAYLLNDKIDYLGEKIIEKYFWYRKKSFFKMYTSNEELFKQMIYTDSSSGKFCDEPFKYANVQPYGYVYSCCPSYGYNKIGNILFKSPKKLWNSNAAKLQRLSIINKTFTYCDDKLCPFRTNESRNDKVNSRFENVKNYKSPQKLYVAIDESCNLKCKSCRNEAFNATGLGLALRKFLERRLVNSNWCINSERLVMAGQGEVFFSKIYQKMLYKSKLTKRKNIEILTNGTMLDKEKLDKLCNIYSDISICVTVDAAKEDTYKKIRIGGSYKKLSENLKYMGECRRQNKITHFELLFVVQNRNYAEMPEFIEMAEMYGADRVSFSQITNWGTWTDDEFYKNVSMVDKKGNIKPELKKVLENKIFKKAKIAQTSNIVKYVER